ncbi:MAG: TetR/AcrR family transcriptional regulator [Deltaproteobacteria bacterium]|nr:TetR/AcrR family transcriptional regulator [Deltaproteobacteria bacterium]
MPKNAQDIFKKQPPKRSNPPAKKRIAAALKILLEEKDFNSITTAEIAKAARANEALIYRYFGDKRGLLHGVLAEYLEESQDRIRKDLKGVKGAKNRLRKIVWHAFYTYNGNRTHAKIVLIEVRNFNGYYKSDTYQLARNYSKMVLDVLREGVESGEFRQDLDTKLARNVILGGIEHLTLPGLIFDREIPPDEYADFLMEMVLSGITP